MQKLITIYLNDEGYRIREGELFYQSHGFVEEYLGDYICNGWEIKLVTSVGGVTIGNDCVAVASGWLVVLLEKL